VSPDDGAWIWIVWLVIVVALCCGAVSSEPDCTMDNEEAQCPN
jgi:hypothetical protein